VRQGVEQINHLEVRVQDGHFTFFVNGEEVGQATDLDFAPGDIGILVEALGEGDVTVAFDNFEFRPAD
jgi:hypothetical protein